MLSRLITKKEREKLGAMRSQLVWNKAMIEKDKNMLKTELTQQLASTPGLAFSFGAGCATVIAYKNREHLSELKNLPWREIFSFAKEMYLAPEQPSSSVQAPRQNPR